MPEDLVELPVIRNHNLEKNSLPVLLLKVSPGFQARTE